MVRLYGIWVRDEEDLFVKDKNETETVIKLIPEEESVYCFISFGTRYSEYEKETDNPKELCQYIMKKESHGEDIIDILEEKNFKKL